MLKVWRRPHPRNCKKSRSALLVSVFIFRNWTRTFICPRFCKASLALANGWHPGLDRLVANREASPSEQLREPTANWEEGPDKQDKKAVAVADPIAVTVEELTRPRTRAWGSIPSLAPKTQRSRKTGSGGNKQ